MISGALLREARLRAGLTQAELAHRAGAAPSAIGRWERSEALPSLERLRMLIAAAGLDLGFTLTESDDHDDVLIARMLALDPHERLAGLVVAKRRLEEMAAAVG